MKDLPSQHLAIIGGGFCGTMVAAHLLRRSDGPQAITLIERVPSPGRGVAYGTTDPAHLLNVPASNMSAYPDDPGHFLRWAQAESSRIPALAEHPIQPSSFLPRILYAMYLNAQLNEARASASDRAQFNQIQDEAIGLKINGDAAQIFLKSGQVVNAARVVLALGNFKPRLPVANADSFSMNPRYIGNAWAAQALARVAPTDTVLLIGSGLTMADVVISLEKRGHRGPIHVVSRHAFFPQPHRIVNAHPSFLDPNALPKTTRSLLRLLRHETDQAKTTGQDWRAVVDSMRPLLQQLWRTFELREQARFLRHVRPYWEIHRHRVPQEIFKVIEDLQRSGRLRVQAARIVKFREEVDQVAVTLRPRGSDSELALRTQWVINCTGPECDIRRIQDPFIHNLLDQELIRPDPLGLGMDANLQGALLDHQGRPSKILFTLGPAMRGALWETTAVPELRVQAQTLSRHLWPTNIKTQEIHA